MTDEDDDERGRSSQPGIESWHCFSSGPYYDPARIAWGPVIGLDEHLVAPGAGFDWHAHRGVYIASWVLNGALWHEDSGGGSSLVTPGELFVQSTGSGIRHREWNASDEPLRFVQITIMAEAEPDTWSTSLPTEIAGVTVDVVADEVHSDARRLALPLVDGHVLVLRI